MTHTPAPLTTDLLVRAYMQLRSLLEQHAEAYAKLVNPINQSLEVIENELTGRLHELGDTDEGHRHIKTPYGTVYREKWTSVKVDDPEPWFEFVFNIQGVQFMTKHVAKEAVMTWMEEHNGSLPPGIKLDAGWKTRVRKT